MICLEIFEARVGGTAMLGEIGLMGTLGGGVGSSKCTIGGVGRVMMGTLGGVTVGVDATL